MLTRIVSGAVLIIVTSAIVFVTLFYNLPIVMLSFLSLLSAMAVYELLNNTGIVKRKLTSIVATAFAAVFQLGLTYLSEYVWYAAIAYAVFAVFICVADKMTYKRVVFTAITPVAIAIAFNCIAVLTNLGLVYLLLLLNFSSVCDCGAYFVGVTLGKHKLCPKISPKKTIEGAVGGILLSMIVTAVIARLFSLPQIWQLVLITPVLCVASMCGDLLASFIKRRVGLKDYGKIIPGHGGIMDRFDSILLIAPIYVMIYSLVG